MAQTDNLPLLVFPHFPARALAERDIITRAIHGLLAHGFELSVWDGDSDTTAPRTRDAQEVANQLWTTDDDWLMAWLDGSRVGWVRLVYGNDGADVVSDYTTNLEGALQDANARAEELSA